MTTTHGRAIALGVFDGVHLGHRAVIEAAVAGRADGLIPEVFTFDETQRLPKAGDGGGYLLTPTLKRAAIESLGVESIVEQPFSAFAAMEPRAFVEEYLIGEREARRIACGDDYRFGRGAAGDVTLLRTLCDEHGVALTVVPPVLYDDERVSSTGIRRLLQEGDVERVAVLLGRSYGYDLPVVHGRQVGRRLLLPTVNQVFPALMCVPRYGVYASRAELSGNSYAAVTNVGVRPTFGGGAPVSETHIIDFDGDVYGERVLVTLHRFLRDERRFASVDELHAQIERDRQQALAVTTKG